MSTNIKMKKLNRREKLKLNQVRNNQNVKYSE